MGLANIQLGIRLAFDVKLAISECVILKSLANHFSVSKHQKFNLYPILFLPKLDVHCYRIYLFSNTAYALVNIFGMVCMSCCEEKK